jgi:hypothetical protein
MPGQVWIWSWFNDFLLSNVPFTLKIIWNFQFLFIISPIVLHIQLKFDVSIFQKNGQVKFEFGHGSMIFGSFVPFTLKIISNFQFPFIISTMVQHIQLKFIIWICHDKIQVKFEFGHGSMIFGRVMPLLLWNDMKFSVSVQYLHNGTTYSTQTWYMDMSWENTGQVWIWLWFDDFYAPTMWEHIALHLSVRLYVPKSCELNSS